MCENQKAVRGFTIFYNWVLREIKWMNEWKPSVFIFFSSCLCVMTNKVVFISSLSLLVKLLAHLTPQLPFWENALFNNSWLVFSQKNIYWHILPCSPQSGNSSLVSLIGDNFLPLYCLCLRTIFENNASVSLGPC